MVILRENRDKILRLAATLFFAVSLFYFSYHAIAGQKGILAMFKVMHKLDKAKAELDSVKAEKVEIERKVDMLYNKSLDTDMLDEQSRKLLGVAGKNEVIYFIPKAEQKPQDINKENK